MSAYTFSFIGTGNMGYALARAASKSLPPEKIILSNRTPAKAEALARELGCAVGSAAQAAEQADYLFLGVKPQMMAGFWRSWPRFWPGGRTGSVWCPWRRG